MHCYNIARVCVYSVNFFKYILKGIWLQMKFGEIFLGDVKIDALKGGRGIQVKGK